MGFIKSLKRAKVGFRLLVAVDIILIGVVGMLVLSKLKKPPVEVPPPKPVIRVEVKKMQPEDVPVFITGYGEVTALKSVRVAPEVAGKVVGLHPNLQVGGYIGKDDVLFEIDKRDYMTVYKDARSTLSRMTNTIERLKQDQKITESRLQTMVRNRDLAREEFERLNMLYEKSKIGTQSQVDAAERSYIATEDQLAQMTQAVQTYPLQIKEAGYQLESAKTVVFRAATNLRRCAVKAPFAGRIKEATLEIGQYVAPGQGLILLVDDTTLEIAVPIDSSDADQWLQFGEKTEGRDRSWFSALKKVPVTVRWTEDSTDRSRQGILDRVTRYDKQTRTLTVAVRINSQADLDRSGRLPLVEGMFCAVTIPGKIMRQVYRLPRWAVGFNDTTYLAVDGRLKTVPVSVVRIQGDEAFISGGLKRGDRVITTRLVNPLENSLLEIITWK